jgi:hypothetical protein
MMDDGARLRVVSSSKQGFASQMTYRVTMKRY